MVSRVVSVENTSAESSRFPEDYRSGVLASTKSSLRLPNLMQPLQERKIATNLFLTADNLPTALATSIESTKSTASSKAPINTEEPRGAALPAGQAGRLMSKDDQARIRELIANAKTPEEITRLERSLKEGYVPSVTAVGA